MGKIVRKLRLFDDDTLNSNTNIPALSNNFNAPVQVFNGPVFFGNSSDSLQNLMNKRPREVDSGNTVLKRRYIETKEETYFS